MDQNEKLKGLLNQMREILEGNEPKNPEEQLPSEDTNDPEDMSDSKELAKAALVNKLRKKLPQ